MRVLGLLLAATLGVASPLGQTAKISYDGYKVYRVSLNSQHEASLRRLPAVELQRRRGSGETSTVDLAVSPAAIQAFEATGLTATATLLSRDLGADIDAEVAGQSKYERTATGSLPSLDWFDAYHAYEDHVGYWADLHAAFPENSELITVGESFEGRALQGIHLFGKDGKDEKPAIFFNGNVHAREWITSMVVEYILYQLISGYAEDEVVTKILDNYDFYVLPVVNPDAKKRTGFAYSQTTDRLWRKNRQTRSNTTAIGTDINRNWAVGWGGAGGSSSDPSDEEFSGFAPLDAPETAALAAYAARLRDLNGIKLYVDWHSPAQVILLSYGYTCDDFPANVDEQVELAKGVSEAIAKPYNTTFAYGPGCLVLYQSNGNGRDYLTDVGKAEFGWGIELRDTQYGFLLPAAQILPSGIEIWEGMKYIWGQF
ncbi:hypothetical protein GGR50DRAFT_360125 [Xylaria sp. CBS 124048]|nr:hypothetical protein GGR50DRAFT_360125 [Xylaria sp. CBS 124048]